MQRSSIPRGSVGRDEAACVAAVKRLVDEDLIRPRWRNGLKLRTKNYLTP